MVMVVVVVVMVIMMMMIIIIIPNKKLISVKIYFNNQLNTQFLYSITICRLHYNPRHVSSINMAIFRRTNCIITASGIVTCRIRADCTAVCSYPTYCTAVYRE
jgi:hypothetical protein